MYGYESVLQCGWKTGVHDCRGIGYQHPWLAVCRETWSVVGCWSREEARRVLRDIKAGREVAY